MYCTVLFSTSSSSQDTLMHHPRMPKNTCIHIYLFIYLCTLYTGNHININTPRYVHTFKNLQFNGNQSILIFFNDTIYYMHVLLVYLFALFVSLYIIYTYIHTYVHMSIYIFEYSYVCVVYGRAPKCPRCVSGCLNGAHVHQPTDIKPPP